MLAGLHRSFLTERVIWGRAAQEVALEEVIALGKCRVLIISSKGLSAEDALPARIAGALGKRHVGTYYGVRPHVPAACVFEGAAVARQVGADHIIAVGGGSVIDASKTISLAYWRNIPDLKAYQAYRKPTDFSRLPSGAAKAVRITAVPTTFSAAEFTHIAGISDTERGIKEPYYFPLFAAQCVILDPKATLTTPHDVLLPSGIKALDHAVERICMPNCTPFAEATALKATQMLSRSLPAIRKADGDLDARVEAQLGMWLSITGAGSTVGVGVSHALGHTLGGTYKLAHGITACVTMAASLKWNKPANAERQKLVSAAFGKPDADAGDLLRDFVKGLGLPVRLRDVGLTKGDFGRIAEITMSDPPIKDNPRPVSSASDIEEILHLAW